MNKNPVLAEVTRGGIVESFHRGSYAIVDREGEIIANSGEISRPVFPRSAIKSFQVLPLIECGAAEAYGFSKPEIALACSSHCGETDHISTVRSMLEKAGLNQSDLGCGSDWPLSPVAGRKLACCGGSADDLHNNCSGKHTGMLATAHYLDEPLAGYTDQSHPVQRRIAATISQLCEYDLTSTRCGIDGCSVPTWAIPIQNLALGFANLANSYHADNARSYGVKTVIDAVRQAPFMISGTDKFCTDIMTAVPRIFVKDGAEGMCCGAIPHAGIGIALKCDDGAGRAAAVVFAKIASALDIWSSDEKAALAKFCSTKIKNPKGHITGEIRAC